jgi:transposase InsO family protein
MNWTVEMMCAVLEVSASSYYYDLRMGGSKRKQRKDEAKTKISETYFASRQRYGSPRIAMELTKMGYSISQTTVSKRMNEMGIRSRIGKKYKVTTDSNHKEPIADNILNRDFYASAPGEKCVSDITYIQTIEGFIYLTTVLDLYDRKIIGWSLSDGMKTSQTVLPALKNAIANRKLKKNMIFHSDRGVQYCCKQTVNYLNCYQFQQSMSRKGNCWDNAVAESFFKTFKAELIYGCKLKTKEQLRLEIFEYIECWYNKKRRHSALDNLTIDEFNNECNKYSKNVA